MDGLFEVIVHLLSEIFGEALARPILKIVFWLVVFGLAAGSFYLWWRA